MGLLTLAANKRLPFRPSVRRTRQHAATSGIENSQQLRSKAPQSTSVRQSAGVLSPAASSAPLPLLCPRIVFRSSPAVFCISSPVSPAGEALSPTC
ncbi:unnamed protein product [Linum trigynum]|uniref:Uncharacterized protein n=1 Tax=Linum trigynum TaxID=586398 RepID=A0AAV2FL77_9ROSI